MRRSPLNENIADQLTQAILRIKAGLESTTASAKSMENATESIAKAIQGFEGAVSQISTSVNKLSEQKKGISCRYIC